MPAPAKSEKMSDPKERTLTSTMEIAFLALVVAGFLFFIGAVGGLQWWLSRKPAERRDDAAREDIHRRIAA
jgi:hypothetical protein